MVSALGAALGFVNGWAPCHSYPLSLASAGFGALVFAWFFALPAAILGGAVGAVFSHGLRGVSIGMSMLLIAALALALGLSVPFLIPAHVQEPIPASSDL
ncbi:hypothetical protein [Aquisphaera giovannonii]|uniref:hypothetical protein n=1 Tax=Aquisphaera giovannonii TaxID=406548 RepID=UPI0011E05F40|nr:hypothetical protein [Aquisphaera giovannonii]